MSTSTTTTPVTATPTLLAKAYAAVTAISTDVVRAAEQAVQFEQTIAGDLDTWESANPMFAQLGKALLAQVEAALTTHGLPVEAIETAAGEILAGIASVAAATPASHA